MKEKVTASATATPTPVRRGRGRPAQDASVGRDVLLRNARKTFGTRGYDATSVREIARESGVDPALLAHHFGSKEALWTAVVEQIAEHARPLIAGTGALRDADLDAKARVDRAMEIYIDKVFEEPDIGLFFSTAATEEGARMDFLVERLMRPYYDVLVPLLDDAAKQGVLKVKDADMLFFVLLNGVSKTVGYGHLMRAFSSLPDNPEQFKRTVLETTLSLLA
ncbi:TetR/AcrR family transcriptional regulator [Paraburkholderia sp. Ac-20340]|uniref:TetR/AcrR family transcriptional regulator n=1 Tax=Paraburkholderia sp. Ac-20340 TaxID=2703888 RepID=UPI00197FCB7C|nr:TetR/AcrR family transcriptional regulator [Paraburkholderia sp. Ac-20340]MBN3852129.1 TetR/AcrR family transcriptional regulator [Paraburkholderia sp. Ac-20340]